MRTHNEKSHPFQCPVCQHGYTTISALTNHLKNIQQLWSVNPINQINTSNDDVAVNAGKTLKPLLFLL